MEPAAGGGRQVVTVRGPRALVTNTRLSAPSHAKAVTMPVASVWSRVRPKASKATLRVPARPVDAHRGRAVAVA